MSWPLPHLDTRRVRHMSGSSVDDGGAWSAATTVRDSAIPTSAISGGASSLSSTQEPSTDANGSNIFQTGNWYATRSTDNGSTWSYLDPYSLFGSGFCCDQVTQYDPGTGRQFWLLQFSDHLVIANATASGTGTFTNRPIRPAGSPPATR